MRLLNSHFSHSFLFFFVFVFFCRLWTRFCLLFWCNEYNCQFRRIYLLSHSPIPLAFCAILSISEKMFRWRILPPRGFHNTFEALQKKASENLSTQLFPHQKLDCRNECCYVLYETLCAIWHHLHNLKNVENTHGGVVLIAFKFNKSNTLPWVFFSVFKLYKWYQIVQSITCVSSHIFLFSMIVDFAIFTRKSWFRAFKQLQFSL